MVFCHVFVRIRLHSAQVLLNILPRTLRMQMRTWTPTSDNFSETGNRKTPAIDRNDVFLIPCRRRSSMTFIHKADEYMMKTARSELMFNKLKERNGLMKSILEKMRKDESGLSLRMVSTSATQLSVVETLVTSSNPRHCPGVSDHRCSSCPRLDLTTIYMMAWFMLQFTKECWIHSL